MADSLVDRLRAAIDETARIAQAALDQSAEEDSTWWWDSPESPREEHISHHRPEAVLRRCVADRKILDLHTADSTDEPLCNGCGGAFHWPCPTLAALAEAYGVEEPPTYAHDPDCNTLHDGPDPCPPPRPAA